MFLTVDVSQYDKSTELSHMICLNEHPEFDFEFLEKFQITEKSVKKFSKFNYNNFISYFKNQHGQCIVTSEKNSLMIIRGYSAVKMILASSLLLNSAEYSIHKNLLTSTPYLLYYAALSACRAFLYTSASTLSLSWEKIFAMSHQTIINRVQDMLKNHVDQSISKEVGNHIKYLRTQRELFSYKFPSQGIRDKFKFEDTVNVCGLLGELAELSSRRLQAVFENRIIQKNNGTIVQESWMTFDENILSEMFSYESVLSQNFDMLDLVDDYDWHRIGYLDRNLSYPVAISHMATPGMVEDFFGSWYRDNADKDDFDPDINCGIIFPFS